MDEIATSGLVDFTEEVDSSRRYSGCSPDIGLISDASTTIVQESINEAYIKKRLRIVDGGSLDLSDNTVSSVVPDSSKVSEVFFDSRVCGIDIFLDGDIAFDWYELLGIFGLELGEGRWVAHGCDDVSTLGEDFFSDSLASTAVSASYYEGNRC